MKIINRYNPAKNKAIGFYVILCFLLVFISSCVKKKAMIRP